MLLMIAEYYSWLPSLLSGLGISLLVALLSLSVGIPLGLGLALLVQSAWWPARWFALFIVEIGRGAPALVILQFVYFGLPTAGLTLGAVTSAVIALAWNTGAYTSEIIRAGLEAVPAGQKEAAITINLSRIDTLRFIILPQAFRVVAPPLLGFSILIFQATSLCFTISVPELVSRAYEIGSNTFQYFPVLMMAGILYAVICIPASLIVSHAERKAGQHL
ncbi:amino acid ABC transporter permease [Mesorhizobium sp. Cs1299R1N1]|uniref:amino acid ABC transporter permease n=1 Tax=Mesorhizobium sp. Cs1299R1N1 TaxID=3015172 RepID=UPI00301D9B6E